MQRQKYRFGQFKNHEIDIARRRKRFRVNKF